MKPNKLTEGSNLMWTSSRMIIPEHREAMLRELHEEKRKTKPLFDEQFAEQIGRFLVETHRTKTPVNLRMFDPFDDVRVIGIIERLDALNRRFMVDGEWFRAADIVELGMNTE